MTKALRPLSPSRLQWKMNHKKAALYLAMMSFSVVSVQTRLAAAAEIQGAVVTNIKFNIPAGDLSDTLQQYSQQSGVQVIVPSELIQGLKSRAISGNYKAPEVLSQLLQDTKLVIKFSNDKTAVLTAPNSADIHTLGVVNIQGSTDNISSIIGGISAANLSPLTGGNGSRDSSATEGNKSYAYGNVSVGGRSTIDSQKIVQSVSVVGDQQLKDSHATTIKDGLANATGVTVSSESGVPTYFVRGEKIDNYSVDGVGTEDKNNLVTDLSLYDHIEVLRGSDAFLNSSDGATSGGSVNLVRKKPLDHRQFMVDLSVGSWHNYRGSVDLTGALNREGTLRGRIIATSVDKDLFTKNSYYKTNLLDTRLEYDLTPNTTLSFGGTISKEKSNRWPGLPRSTDGSDLKLPRSFSIVPSWLKQSQRIKEFDFGLDHNFNDDWSFHFNTAQKQIESFSNTLFIPYTENFLSSSSDAVKFLYASTELQLKTSETNLNASLLGRAVILGLEQKIELSGQYRRYFTKGPSPSFFPINNILINHFNSFDFFNLANPNMGVTTTELYNSVNRARRNSLYAKFDLQIFPALHLLTGPRWQESHISSTESNNQIMNHFSVPYYALRYDINPKWSVYGSYTDQFQLDGEHRMFDGKFLPPMTGGTKELGLKFSSANKDLTASFAIYQTHLNNVGIYDLDPTHIIPNDRSCCYLPNGAKNQGQGVDLEIAGAVTPFWQASLGYTYNKNESKQENSPNNLGGNTPVWSFVPFHVFKLANTFSLSGGSFLDRAQMGFDMTYQSSARNVDPFNSMPIEQKGFTVANVFARFALSDAWSAQLNINNIFNQRYYEAFSSVQFGNFYGSPREALFSLQGKF